MKLDEVRRRRLYSHRLDRKPDGSVSSVLGAYGAVQAQEFAEAKWSLAQRSAAVVVGSAAAAAEARAAGGGVVPTDAAMQRAYDEGAILRTHMLRPTWHFVRPSDLRWIQALTGSRVHVQNGTVYRKHDLEGALHARVRTLLETWLADGVAMTRQEIAAALARAGIEAAGQRLAYIVMHAELEAVLCSGPSKGNSGRTRSSPSGRRAWPRWNATRRSRS
jgi:Winged helix DNA-binding domain